VTEASVSAGYAKALVTLALANGADGAALLTRAGLAAADFMDEERRVPFAKYAALMRGAQELAGDPALALHFGEAFDMADISLFGLIARASETFADLVVQMNRFQRLGADIDPSTAEPYLITRDAKGSWMVDARKIPADFPEHTEAVFSRMVCGARRLTEIPLAKEVHVRHRAPAYRDEYARVFKAPVVFESDRNALLLEEAWLGMKNPLASRYAFGVLTEKAEALVKAIEASTSTRAQVERLLLPMLHTGGAGMDQVAAKLGVSRKTLFRWLKSEGVTFERVLDELRQRMALDYLSARRVSVNETAYLVGFSEPAAFTRAFKRWTGVSPREMRGR
jgi:AraC-like DNA-binding protein